MIVTLVCDFLGAPNNGTTIFSYNLIQALCERGHSVNVLCPDQEKKELDTYFVLPERSSLTSIEKRFTNTETIFAKPNRPIIREAVLGTDAVFIMTPFTLGKYVVEYAIKHKIPIVASFHTQADPLVKSLHLGSRKSAIKAIYKKMYDDVYKHCDAIHFPSSFICSSFEGYVGLVPHHVIPTGLNPDFNTNISHARPSDNNIRILYTARLSKSKNHKLLIDSIKFSKYKNRIQLIFAGEGNYREAIEKEAYELINKPIMKQFSRADYIKTIGSCDLYVHAALDEIEGIACIEAIACGLIPIINNSPTSAATAYAINPTNLCDYNDPKDLAQKIDYWIDNPEEQELCMDEYQQFIQKYKYDECMDAMVSMIKKVVY